MAKKRHSTCRVAKQNLRDAKQDTLDFIAENYGTPKDHSPVGNAVCHVDLVVLELLMYGQAAKKVVLGGAWLRWRRSGAEGSAGMS